jgi:hypothetical protein
MKHLAWLLVLAFASPASAQRSNASMLDERVGVVADLAAARVLHGERHPEVVRLRAELEARPELVLAAAERDRFCALVQIRSIDLRRRDLELSMRYGDSHPERRQMRARIDAVEVEMRRHCPVNTPAPRKKLSIRAQ